MPKKVITYRLTLEDPVVLSIPGGDPNSAETLSYISGSAVVGALAGLWKKQNASINPVAFQSLFLNGNVRYLNVYPEGSNNRRLFPPPLSLRVEKGTQSPVYDLVDPQKDEILESQDDEGLFRQFQTWTQGYIRFADNALKYRMPLKTSRIHHQRDRDWGRAREDQDAIFSYISIDAGERFIGHIFLDDELQVTVLQNLFQAGHIQLGRSRCAQYGGRANLTLISTEDGETFMEAGCGSFDQDDQVTVTLLSDYMGVNPNGHITPDAFLFDLADALNVTTESIKVLDKDRYVRTRPISGYVSTWEMPRPVVPAFQAGSVFVLKFHERISPQNISDLLWNGIGERRIEGFGRIAINWHGQNDEDEPLTRRPEMDTLMDLPAPDQTFPDNPGLFLLSRKRLLEQDLNQAVIKASSRMFYQTTNIPNRSLLGRLRELLRTASDTQGILNFLENCRRPAEKQLDRCRLNNNYTLKEWLTRLFSDSAWLMQEFNMQNDNSLSAASGKYFENVQPEQLPDGAALLWTYQKRLADMVLQGLVRLSKEDSTK
jgi:CRISPR-associated protein Csx10